MNRVHGSPSRIIRQLTVRYEAVLVGSCFLALVVAGCTPQAREDVSKAGDNLNDAAVKSAIATKKDVASADAKVSADSKVDAEKSKAALNKADAKVTAEAKIAAQKTDAAVDKLDAGAKKDVDAVKSAR